MRPRYIKIRLDTAVMVIAMLFPEQAELQAILAVSGYEVTKLACRLADMRKIPH